MSAIAHIFMLITLWFGFNTAALASDVELKPVLELNTKSIRRIPLIELALRDPKQELKAKDQDDAEDFLDDAKDDEDDFKDADKEDKLKLAESALKNYLAVAYYLEDLELGRVEGKKIAKLNAIRAKVGKFAKALVGLTKDPALKDRGRFHVFAVKYLIGKENTVAKALLKAPIKIASDSPYKDLFEFLAGIAELSKSSPESGISRLNKLSTSLSEPAITASLLAEARALAGFDLAGQKARDSQPSYTTYLNKATLTATEYDIEVRENVFEFAVGVWMNAEDDKIDWDKIPISLQVFEDIPERHALEERKALAQFKQGKTAEALELYNKVLTAFRGEEEYAKLTQHYLDLHLLVAKKTNNYETYANALFRVDTEFRDKDILGETNEDQATAANVAKKFHTRYATFVLQTIRQARAANATADTRAAAIKSGTAFIGRATSTEEKVNFLSEIAALHVMNGDHARAVDTYSEILKLSKGPADSTYLEKAIASQRVLAKWPATPPWDKVQPGDEAARKKLITFYQMALKNKSDDWSIIAHIGLLQLSMDARETAYKLWLPLIAKNSVDDNARRAAGQMLTFYKDDKKWRELVGLCHIAMKSKLEPIHNGKVINLTPFLGDGLYAGGMEALEKKENKQALAFLEEFLKSYKSDKRYGDVLFKAGLAYLEIRDSENFAQTMKEVVEKYPKSPNLKEAIVKGMDFSKDESHKVFFHEMYLKHFNGENGAVAVRESLGKLYTNLTMYPKAIKIYEAQDQDKRVNTEGKLSANYNIITLEEKHGDIEKAKKAADRMTKLTKTNQVALGRAYAFYVRYYAKKKQTDKFDQYAKLVDAFDGRDKEVAASIAQIRYFVAMRNFGKPLPYVDPKALKDPPKEMQNQVTIFQGLKTDFDKVCEVGETDFCAPAKDGLSDAAQRSYDMIQSINLTQAPDEKSYKDFEAKKAQILKIVSASILKTKSTSSK